MNYHKNDRSMETKEIKKSENIKKLVSEYLNALKPATDKTDTYNAEIKLLNYYELGCIITNMLKLCILAPDQETHKITETNKNLSINVGLILETILQLFPMNELELLDKINELSAES